MPQGKRSNQIKRPLITLESLVEQMIDGPVKDIVEASIRDLESCVIDQEQRLEKLVQNAGDAVDKMLIVTLSKIPKHQQEMKFHSYLDMLDAESKIMVRESFQTNLKQICDLKGDSRPDIEQEVQPLIAITNQKNPASTKEKQKRQKNLKLSTVTKKSGKSSTTVSKRSAPNNISSLNTPHVNGSASTFTNNWLTPKFDPRFPITPAHGLRKPHANEKIILMSQRGSPLSNETGSNLGAAIVLSLEDGHAIAISSETKFDELPFDKSTLDNFRDVQLKMATITKRGLSSRRSKHK